MTKKLTKSPSKLSAVYQNPGDELDLPRIAAGKGVQIIGDYRSRTTVEVDGNDEFRKFVRDNLRNAGGAVLGGAIVLRDWKLFVISAALLFAAYKITVRQVSVMDDILLGMNNDEIRSAKPTPPPASAECTTTASKEAPTPSTSDPHEIELIYKKRSRRPRKSNVKLNSKSAEVNAHLKFTFGIIPRSPQNYALVQAEARRFIDVRKNVKGSEFEGIRDYDAARVVEYGHQLFWVAADYEIQAREAFKSTTIQEHIRIRDSLADSGPLS